MRKRVYVVAGVAAGAGLIVVAAMAAAQGSGGGTSAEPTRLVSYHGYTAAVPVSWPVYDLSKDPTRCVRFDQHAVYLGTPGKDQRCPAHLVGRTEALLVQPLSSSASPPAEGVHASAGELRKDLRGAQVAVTASYSQDKKLASSLLNSAPRQAATSTTPTTVAPATTATRPARSATATPSASGSATPSSTPTPSASAVPAAPDTPTGTPSDSPPATPTSTPTGTATDTPSDAAAATPSDSTSVTPSGSATPAEPTPSASSTPLNGATRDPSGTSATPSPTSSLAPDAVASGTPTPSSPDDNMTVGPSPSTTVSRPDGFTVPSALLTSGTRGFDTCAAPSTATMSAWSSTDLDSIGIYVGGINRACDDGNLSASWVQTVHGYGYSFIPIYVGHQAPCTTQDWAKVDPTQAAAQGRADADDAAADMQRFGLGTGNPVYLDIEHYDATTACTTAVREYVTGWTLRLHQYGYGSGVYGSVSAAPHDLALVYSSTTYTVPDVLYFARWNDVADVDSEPYVSDTLWQSRRIKQYQGGHDETHGGVTINIDSDYLEGMIGLPGNF